MRHREAILGTSLAVILIGSFVVATQPRPTSLSIEPVSPSLALADNDQALIREGQAKRRATLAAARVAAAERARVAAAAKSAAERAAERQRRASRSRALVQTPVVRHHVAAVRRVESQPAPAGAYAWAHTTDAIKVANCESGDRSDNSHYNGNAHIRGKYSGKWQMDSSFWSTYGGRQYGSNPADASESQQDAVAYRGYLARGWQPWSCSRIMGVR